jgi:ribosomal protein S4
MAKIFKSKFKLLKRYARFSNTCVYMKINERKKIRYGYKVYQKIFRRYRSKGTMRINVRKPRIPVKRKKSYGKALESKEKLSYLMGGIHSNKLKKYVHISKSKTYSPIRSFLQKLETRLDIVVYRMQITSNPRLIKDLIVKGYVKVNGKIQRKPSFQVKKCNYVDINVPSYIYKKVKKYFKESLKKRLIFKPFTNHLETNYKIFRSILHDYPTEKSTFYPFNFKAYYFFRLYPR